MISRNLKFIWSQTETTRMLASWLIFTLVLNVSYFIKIILKINNFLKTAIVT